MVYGGRVSAKPTWKLRGAYSLLLSFSLMKHQLSHGSRNGRAGLVIVVVVTEWKKNTIKGQTHGFKTPFLHTLTV